MLRHWQGFPSSRSRAAFRIAYQLPLLTLCITTACQSPLGMGHTEPLTTEMNQHTSVVVHAVTPSGAPVAGAAVTVSPVQSLTGMNSTYSDYRADGLSDGRYMVLLRRATPQIFTDTITARVHVRTTGGRDSTRVILVFVPLNENPPKIKVQVIVGAQ